MVYTEIKEKNKRKYYYRVRSTREGKKFKKERIYLGTGLNEEDLKEKEKQADEKLLKNEANKNLAEIKSKIIRIFKKNNIKRAGIFGSYVRGKQKKNSDVDILIEPPKGMGFEFAGVGIELEKKLGRKVHLVTYKYLSPYIKNEILKDEVRII